MPDVHTPETQSDWLRTGCRPRLGTPSPRSRPRSSPRLPRTGYRRCPERKAHPCTHPTRSPSPGRKRFRPHRARTFRPRTPPERHWASVVHLEPGAARAAASRGRAAPTSVPASKLAGSIDASSPLPASGALAALPQPRPAQDASTEDDGHRPGKALHAHSLPSRLLALAAKRNPPLRQPASGRESSARR